MIHDSILRTIGNTPVVQLTRIEPKGTLFAKIESFNPLGSVKDRLALGVIEAAERAGALRPGQTVIEATSGNTGIGLAMVCARKGYPLVIVMSEAFSVERRRLMRFLGAQVVLTPASEKGSGMVEKARELAEHHGWFWTRQFENPANAAIHERTTAQEILAAFSDGPLDYFVTGAGTGGTLSGVARALRAQSPNTRIVVAEPENAPMLGSGVPQDYLADGTPAQSHPMFRPHPVQGWSPDFVPELVSRAMQDGLVDIVQPVGAHEGLRLARHLARREGILAGISAGATLAAAMRIAETAPAGSRILFMVPDTGERYLSTVLFEDIGQEMDADERAISASTPLCRFGEPPVKAPVAAAPMPLPTPRAMKEVRAAIADLSRPVVIFGLEWCEFTWAAARFLRDIGVPCRQVQLDSAEMLNTSLGGEIRAALRQLTGQPTIPQVFALGRHLGGAMDLMEMHDRGELVPMLEQHGVTVEGDRDVLARGYLPSWLASRSA